MQSRNYGLVTAITMITGIVIGSGIFFKADNILEYANGNVFLGVIIFVVAAIAVVFGALTISQLAIRTDKPGGIVSYAEDFVGNGAATMFGWFETFLYLPTLDALVAWASGIYISQLLGFQDFSVGRNTIIGLIVVTVFYLMNAISAKAGGWFQNTSMFIKLIPLLLIAALGLIFGNPGVEFSQASGDAFKESAKDLAWLGAFGPIAFSYDGWIVSTSICHEIKDSKKNLPLALTFAPIAVLIVYLAYFLGLTSFLGVDTILEIGDDSVFVAATEMFGDFGAKLILVAVVISILGTVNGVSLGLIRLPYSLALRNMMPFSNTFKKENEKLGGMPVNSAVLVYVLTILYSILNYVIMTSKNEFVAGLDISEIAICVLYLIYIVFYVAVIKLAKKGEIKSKFLGYVAPVLATIGSLIIFSGSVVKLSFAVYAAVCLLFLGIAYLYYKRNKDNIIVRTDEEYHEAIEGAIDNI
ncbi:MAG: APC family permease [Clostridia bacterium]|nr:APC family permease [Clostridia bacterium]